MNRREFMEQLARLLRDIPAKDREEALAYYEGYFDDAGAENEDAVIRELGSPGRIAAEIRATLADDRESGEFTDRGYEDARFQEENPLEKGNPYRGERRGRRKGGTLLIILIAIFTFPIWAGIIGALFSVIMGFVGVLFGLVVGSLAGGVGLIIGAIALAAAAIPLMTTSVGFGFMALGLAMLCMAIGIVLLVVFGWLVSKAIPAAFRLTVNFVQKLVNRLRGGN